MGLYIAVSARALIISRFALFTCVSAKFCCGSSVEEGAGNPHIARCALTAAYERVFEDERRYVILTTPAIGAPSKIHDRMPVFVDREEMKDWLYDESYAKDVLTRKRVCTLTAEVC